MRNSSNAFIAYHARSAELFQSLLVLNCAELVFTYQQGMKARVQLQLHRCGHVFGCCRWMCWTSIPHDAEAERGRGVWSDAPPSYSSLETIVAFQNWSQDRWGQVTIWNESTTNPKSVIFIHNNLNMFSQQYNMYNSALKLFINIILILHIRR